MVKFYVMRIKMGKCRLADVPERYREQVEMALNNIEITL